jgi:putative DNA primase/helicase
MSENQEPKRRRVVRLDELGVFNDFEDEATPPPPAAVVVEGGAAAEIAPTIDPPSAKTSPKPALAEPGPLQPGPRPRETLRLATQDGRLLDRPVIDDRRGSGSGGSAGGGGGAPDEPPVRASEDAAADLLSERIREDWRFVAVRKRWYRWTGRLWEIDHKNAILKQARLVCRQIANKEFSAALARNVSALRTSRAAMEFAGSTEPIAAHPQDFDADPWLLNTPDGLVDLHTGQLLPHDRAKMCTMISRAGPEPMVDCPKWKNFLGEITNGDRDYMDFLQRVVGYSLVGVVDEEVFVFLWGPSNTGKSKFIETWRMIHGDYAGVAPMDSFLPAKGERHPTDLAGFAGKRLIAAAETKARPWDRQRITMLTGRDRISARFMRGDFFDYDPTFLLAFHGNYRPILDGSDTAMRRRLLLLPFSHKPRKIDRHLIDKFRTELPGITAWSVEGCLLWQRYGLAPPKIVTEATDEYFETQNVLGHWVEDHCEIGNMDDYWTRENELYGDFQRAAQSEGVTYFPYQNQFIDQLENAYPGRLKRRRRHSGERGVAGIRLRRRQEEFAV